MAVCRACSVARRSEASPQPSNSCSSMPTGCACTMLPAERACTRMLTLASLLNKALRSFPYSCSMMPTSCACTTPPGTRACAHI